MVDPESPFVLAHTIARRMQFSYANLQPLVEKKDIHIDMLHTQMSIGEPGNHYFARLERIRYIRNSLSAGRRL